MKSEIKQEVSKPEDRKYPWLGIMACKTNNTMGKLYCLLPRVVV